LSLTIQRRVVGQAQLYACLTFFGFAFLEEFYDAEGHPRKDRTIAAATFTDKVYFGPS
jgi:hypothetical protein